jgi:hypothetical protein
LTLNVRRPIDTKDEIPLEDHRFFIARLDHLEQRNPAALLHHLVNGTLTMHLRELSARAMQAKADLVINRKLPVDLADELVMNQRVPNDTFKKNAGTEVTTDILAFRKKNQPKEWVETFINTRPTETGKEIAGTAETVEVNEYFHRHPDMMLGRMTRDGSMYEADSPALIAHPDKELVPQLQAAVLKLPAGIVCHRANLIESEPKHFAQAGANQKEGSYQISNGEVRQVRGGALEQPDFGDNVLLSKQARQWVTLREAAKGLFAKELDPRCGETEIEADRRVLRRLYDGYVQTYGRVNK